MYSISKYKMKENQQIIGLRVSKSAKRPNNEPKPFKSGLKVNTVKGITTNPHTNKSAFTFEEDNSLVDCHACKIVNQ